MARVFPSSTRLVDTDTTDGCDVEWMERIAQGDRKAFEQLYARHGDRLYDLALRILGSRSDSEDALQDALSLAWKRAPQYRPALGYPFQWMAAIVRHRAIDLKRSQMRRLEWVRLVSEAEEPRTESSSASVVLAAIEIKQAVRRALGELSPSERGPILLSFFEGLTHPEISASLSLPIGTVKARIRRGIVKLRPTLRIHRVTDIPLRVFGKTSSVCSPNPQLQDHHENPRTHCSTPQRGKANPKCDKPLNR